MKILAFNGSPRPNGNSSHFLRSFINGAAENGTEVETIVAHKINLKFCQGCLKCNILKRCVIRDDDWPGISQKILESDVLVFATPVYFHHVPAPLKAIIDRFRSFIRVQILENGLKHTPWVEWRKHFVLIMSLGSSVPHDTQPIIELFEFMCEELGTQNKLTTIIGTRLAIANQVVMDEQQLAQLYEKLNLPIHLAKPDFQRNQQLLKNCFELGKKFG